MIEQHLETVEGRDYLRDLILYIINSEWYKSSRQEQFPPGKLGEGIPKRTTELGSKSPFGAFFSDRRPYKCFLCPSGTPGSDRRTLERALGHARSHFKYKPIQGYTNWNTKNDQERRAVKPRRNCLVW